MRSEWMLTLASFSTPGTVSRVQHDVCDSILTTNLRYSAHENASSSATSLYQSTSSILSWKMIHAVLRVWLEMIDTDGKVKKETDWRLQEASIKVLKCA